MTLYEAIKTRISRIRKKIKAEGFDAILLISKENVTYTTGFSGEDSWVLLGSRNIWLITDSRYIEHAKGQCKSCSLVNRSGSMDREISRILTRNRSIKKLAVEGGMKVSLFNMLEEKLDAELKPSANLVANIRQYKDDYEIASMKKAASLAKEVLKASLSQLHTGITESELAGLIEFEMRKRASSPAFDTIAAFGANGSRPHHIPGKRKLRKNDTVLIDFGTKYNGYCCDITRCFVVGKAKDDYLRAYQTVLEAQAAAIKAVKAGVNICDVDKAARDIIKAAGLPDFGHGTGHGLGLYIHELPTVYNGNGAALEAGQVITVEPGVYIPGKLGIRIEDDVLVTENGCRLITRGAASPALEILTPKN
jgi:Xaa-Pro aminopeptidase